MRVVVLFILFTGSLNFALLIHNLGNEIRKTCNIIGLTGKVNCRGLALMMVEYNNFNYYLGNIIQI